MVIIRKKHKESAEDREARLQKEQEQRIGIQDQYQARGFELVSWVQSNKRLVSAAIAVVVIAGALLSGFLYYQKRTAEIASGAYLDALKTIDGVPKEGEENIAKWQKAQADLAALAKTHSGSGVSVLANLYAAHLALENNDAKNAADLYQTAVKKINATDALYPLAMIGLGYAQEKSGEKKASLETFEALAESKSTTGKDLALWEAARLSQELKESDRAKKNLTRLLEEHPASVYEKNAQLLKETLK